MRQPQVGVRCGIWRPDMQVMGTLCFCSHNTASAHVDSNMWTLQYCLQLFVLSDRTITPYCENMWDCRVGKMTSSCNSTACVQQDASFKFADNFLSPPASSYLCFCQTHASSQHDRIANRQLCTAEPQYFSKMQQPEQREVKLVLPSLNM